MTAFNRLFIVSGDPSGDHHGASVVQALKARQPDIQIEAVGGTNLSALGVPLLADQSQMSRVGFGAFTGAPYHFFLAQKILKHLKTFQPDAVLLIDYGGFNLWLARHLKKQGYRIFYFIPPQVWASRKGRLKKIKATVEHVFCIFPFEEALYQKEGIPVTYVGHPLAGQLPPPATKSAFCNRHGLNPHEPVVAVFPGSRRSEIDFLLEPILCALPGIQEATTEPVQFVVAKATAIPADWFQARWETLLNKHPALNGLSLTLVDGEENHALMSIANAGIIKSGTSTLEAALYGMPMVIVYKVQRLVYEIGLKICYMPCLGLPNILTDVYNPPIPELLQQHLTPSRLAETLSKLLFPEREEYQRQMRAFESIRQQLGKAHTPEAVADKLLSLLNPPVAKETANR